MAVRRDSEIFWLLLIVGSLAGEVYGYCDLSSVEKCMTDLEELLSSSGLTLNVELDQVCRVFPKTKKCVSNYMSSCDLDGSMKRPWEKIFDSLDYLCGEGKQDYLHYGSCLQSIGQEEVEPCIPTTGAEKSVPCSKIQSAWNCIHSTVADKCGNEAAKLGDHLLSGMFGLAAEECQTVAGATMLRSLTVPVMAVVFVASYVVG